MDQTQPLDWQPEEEEEERPRQAARDEEPRGRLQVVVGNCDSEKEFPVYRGDNVIGRHESCGVRLAAQSVSKRHAVIEVDDDGHLIYDCNSLNKTRRVRRVLKPGVRYALRDGDLLLFADVACRYFLVPRWSSGSGSGGRTETRGGEAETEAGDSEDDSLALSPTQNYQAKLERTPFPLRTPQAGVYVQDSDDEETSARNKAHPGTSGLNSTQGFGSQSRSKFQTPSNTVVPESDDEGPGSSSPCSPFEGLHSASGSDTAQDGGGSGGGQTPAGTPSLPGPHRLDFLPSLSESESGAEGEEEPSSVTEEGAASGTVCTAGQEAPAEPGGHPLESPSAPGLLPYFNLDSDSEEGEEGAGTGSGPQAVAAPLFRLPEPRGNNNNNNSSSSGSGNGPPCSREGRSTRAGPERGQRYRRGGRRQVGAGEGERG
ncbi:mediator of DNA damage checkpoint protein 1-like [Callorhinchus milii]|uniref:mediator of DNA damage checkpoint protein 1-like n=1 Tax=Callorhinchus milii TaxID=7868 RepID=UPI001C3FB38C|nr:mediator of DNA damage checkpoint protein 1-like [Callorhinchus milii]